MPQAIQFPAGINPEHLAQVYQCLAERGRATRLDLLEATGLVAGGVLDNYLEYLDDRSLIRQVEAGIYMLVARPERLFAARYLTRLREGEAEKRAIANHIVRDLSWGDGREGVAPGSRILVDAGTSTTHVALALKEHGRTPHLLVTNNIHAALQLQESATEVRLIGGKIDGDYAATTQAEGLNLLARDPHFDVGVLAVTALSKESGVGCADVEQHEVKRTIATASLNSPGGHLVLLADHSKFLQNPQASSIFGASVVRSALWRKIRGRAFLVTARWEVETGALPGSTGYYVDNMRYFATEFGERMIVLGTDGKPVPDLEEELDRIDPRRGTRSPI